MDLKQLLDKHVGDVRFTGIYVYSKNLVYVRAQLNSLNDKEIDHTLMLRYKDGEWGQYMIEAPSVGHCIIDDPDQKSMILVPDGHVHVGSSEGFSWEIIDEKPGGPNSLKTLTSMRYIDGSLYVVGMGRMIYKRVSPNNWVRFENGLNGVFDSSQLSGFKSIDGYDQNNLYVVGFYGEMWRFDGKLWKQIISPTNIKLECVVSISPTQVYACGGEGILLVGNEDSWTVVDHELTTDTLWSVESFNASVYFSDSKSLYVYDGDTSKKVNMGFDKVITCSYLHANDGVLWSVGQSDIAYFDGVDWKLLF